MLVPLAPAADQMHLVQDLAEVDAKTGTEINSQLRDSLSYGFYVPKIPIFDAIDSFQNDRLGFKVKA